VAGPAGRWGGHHLAAQLGAWGEQANFASQGEARGRENGGQARQKLQGRQHEDRAPLLVGLAQAVEDGAVVAKRQAGQAERGAQQVAHQVGQGAGVMGAHGDLGMNVDALEAGAQAGRMTVP
jgi:hypothetical protein